MLYMRSGNLPNQEHNDEILWPWDYFRRKDMCVSYNQTHKLNQEIIRFQMQQMLIVRFWVIIKMWVILFK